MHNFLFHIFLLVEMKVLVFRGIFLLLLSSFVLAMPKYKKLKGHTCKFDFPLTKVDCGTVVFDKVEEHYCGWESTKGKDDMTLYDCDTKSVCFEDQVIFCRIFLSKYCS